MQIPQIIIIAGRKMLGLRQRLKAGIRDEEYAQRSIVLAIGHVKILLETIDFGVGVAWSVDIEERRRIGAYNAGPVKNTR
jgi:hypothetical protein